MAEKREFGAGAAIVIGGSGGVGSAICERLAAHGADVALTYRGNEAKAEEAAKTVRAHGRKASTHRVDLLDLENVKAFMDEVMAEFGAIHSIVHAAGSKIDQPYISKVTPEQWREVMDADVNGFFHVAHAALPHLRGGGGGSIVFMSTAGLKRFPPGDILSIAPKGAIEALVRGIAREEGRNKIRANNVAIGVVDAGMFPELVARGELSQQWIDAATKNTALRRFATAHELAEAAVFLASNRASYITGQTLMLDGGYSL